MAWGLGEGGKGRVVAGNGLLDVRAEDQTCVGWSTNGRAEAAEAGPLYINPIIYSEVSIRFTTVEALEDALPVLKDKPMLLLWGERDWCFTTHFRDEFQRRFPDAQSLSFPDAGHYVIEDARERLIARLREFLL